MVYFQELCLKFACSLQDIQVGAECVNVIDTVNGVYMEFLIDASLPVTSFPVTDMATLDPGDLMFNILDEVLKQLDDKAISICSFSGLGSSIKGKNIVIRYRYVVTVTRPLNIKAYYDQVMFRMQNYEYMNTGVQLRPSKSSLKPVDINFASYATFSDHENATKDETNACVPAIAAVDLQFCKAVLISNFRKTTDLTVVVLDTVLEPHEYVFRLGGDGEIMVQVCIDTMRRKLPLRSAGVTQFQAFIQGDGLPLHILITAALLIGINL